MTILPSLFLISITGTIILIAYKYVYISKHVSISNNNEYLSSSLSIFKDKLHELFNSANKQIVNHVLVRLKSTYSTITKSINDKHSTFTDVMNGKHTDSSTNENQRRSISFFLKTVSEHKKKIQEDRLGNK